MPVAQVLPPPAPGRQSRAPAGRQSIPSRSSQASDELGFDLEHEPPADRLIPGVGWDFSGVPVDSRLVVGRPDDRHEQEADRAAEHVMGLPQGAVADALASNHTADVARPASAEPDEVCKKEDERQEEEDEPDDTQVRRACKKCEDEKESSTIRRKSNDREHRREQEFVLDGRALSTGGARLPDRVRAFFEPRFERDFTAVRVHTGPLAETYSDRLHAHSFTYGHHIWMGRGQSVSSTSLMAHELAHVVQQDRSRSIKAFGGLRARRAVTEDSAPIVRRQTPFWEPPRIKGGAGNHTIVLPPMGKENKIFTEAPVPNAGKTGADYGKVGKADLLRASTTVGVYFVADTTPAELESDKDLKKDGARFPHKANAAPQTNVARILIRSEHAPKRVDIGDLKPSFGTPEAAEGVEQVLAYKAGFEMAHREANIPRTLGDGSKWNPFSAHIIGELKIPAQFNHPSFSGQEAESLVLKRFNSRNVVYRPNPPVTGHICVRPDAPGTGIWNYTWVPRVPPRAADLPPKIRRLGPEVVQKILNPLTDSPLVPAKKAKPGPPPTRSALAIQRKSKAVAPAKDNFDHKQWNSDRKRLTDEFKAEKKTQGFKDVEGQLLANQAHEAIRKRFGLNLPEVTGARESAQILDKVEFWTGASAAPFGLFRRVFGTAFVKVAQVIVKVRDRIREFLKKRRSHSGVKTGFLGAALKAAFRVMKMAAAFVVGRVADRLMQSLVTGVTNRLKGMIASEFQEQLAVKAAELDKLKDELERKALDSVDALLKKALGTQLEDLKKLDEVYNLVSDIVGLVNLVRWGARVVACLSPPALGCLWILGEAALDFAAQKVAETCWFQQKIAPLFTKVKYLTTDLPNSLVDSVIGKMREFLPASVHDVFAPVEAGAVTLTKEDIECDEDDTTEYKEHPLHSEIDRLYLKIGEDRAKALSELARKAGPADRALSSGEVAELGDAIVKNGVTADQLLQYAANFPVAPSGMPASISTFIERVKSGKPPAPETTAPEGETPAPTPPEEESKADKKPQPAGGTEKPGEEPAEAGGEGGVPVVDASTRPTDVEGVEKFKGSTVQVINPSSSHTKGTKPFIHVLVSVDGKPKVMVRNIETVVLKRELYPKSATSLENAIGLLVHYAPQRGVDIPEVPGAFIAAYDPERAFLTTLRALVLTRQAEQVLDRMRAAQAPPGR